MNRQQRNQIHDAHRIYNALRRFRRELRALELTDYEHDQLERACGLMTAACGYLRGVVSLHVELKWPDDDPDIQSARAVVRVMSAGGGND